MDCISNCDSVSKEIADSASEELKRLRASKQLVSDEAIKTLTESLDLSEHTCTLLEAQSYVLVLEILLQAEYSLHKERGLYLLAVSEASYALADGGSLE